MHAVEGSSTQAVLSTKRASEKNISALTVRTMFLIFSHERKRDQAETEKVSLTHLQLVLLLVRCLWGKDAEDISDAAGDEKADILAGVFHVEVRGKVQSQPGELLVVILAHLLERSCQQLPIKITRNSDQGMRQPCQLKPLSTLLSIHYRLKM